MQLYLTITTSALDAIQTLEHCLLAVLAWTRANRLRLNPDKTEILLLGGTSNKYGGGMVPKLDDTPLQIRDQMHNLGAFLYPALSCES